MDVWAQKKDLKTAKLTTKVTEIGLRCDSLKRKCDDIDSKLRIILQEDLEGESSGPQSMFSLHEKAFVSTPKSYRCSA